MPLFTGFVNVGLTVYKTQRAVMKGSKKSLSLRSQTLKPAENQRVLFFSTPEVPFEVPFFFYESLTDLSRENSKMTRSRDIISALLYTGN